MIGPRSIVGTQKTKLGEVMLKDVELPVVEDLGNECARVFVPSEIFAKVVEFYGLRGLNAHDLVCELAEVENGVTFAAEGGEDAVDSCLLGGRGDGGQVIHFEEFSGLNLIITY